MDIFDVDNSFINYEGDNLIFGCDINLEHPEISESAYFYDPDSFNDFCITVYTCGALILIMKFAKLNSTIFVYL